ncbi:MAG: hypothetical protein GY866_24915 [Proteobacteria bacterium]|nr:hypothetical protein [Pseudomonadota bacterium]
MSEKEPTFIIEDRVATITLNEPPENQSEVAGLADTLVDHCSRFAADKEIRVIVLGGNNHNSFSMGRALYGGLSLDDLESEVTSSGIAEALDPFKRPILAAIGGGAVGQGLELALACDLRIASETAFFGLPQIAGGQIPRDGGTQRLARAVGTAKALEMVLTGEEIDGREAHRIGLVNRIVPPLQLSSTVMAMARQMAEKGPLSLEYAKEAVHQGMDLTLEQGLRLEADLYYLLQTTRDRTEGIKAFREKRNARFEGR